jgi:hypothetical protein
MKSIDISKNEIEYTLAIPNWPTIHIDWSDVILMISKYLLSNKFIDKIQLMNFFVHVIKKFTYIIKWMWMKKL